MRERGVEFDVIDYLKHPLEREELETILGKLNIPAGDFVRKDKAFDDLGLNADHYGEGAEAEAVVLLAVLFASASVTMCKCD